MSVNLNSSTYPSGLLHAPWRTTDVMQFPFVLDSANEVTKPSVSATGPSSLVLYTLRNQDGSIAAATALFDINYRLPAAATISGLEIGDGAAGAKGTITIPLLPTTPSPSIASATGFGNSFGWSAPVSAIASINDAVMNPEGHFVNLHTAADAAGAMRAQLAPAITTPPVIQATISADMDTNATTVAPGELVSIFGANLSKVETALNGWAGKSLPVSLNGATVTIGGEPAPLIYVDNGQINAQVPLDLAPGMQPVVVNNGAGPSDPFSITVAPIAPAIFFDPVSAVLKSADYSMVSDTNPAHAGDILLVYWTGGGQTTPPVGTGVLVPVGVLARTAATTAMIAGQNANVLYSLASPQFTGLYQTAVTVPSGVTGSVPLMLQVGGVSSNAVNISVK
jgi:uncharacterized protein (TIGR03437 family)